MAITLTIADAANGTGTATIAGSNVASTNTLYKATFNGIMGQYTWTLVGSRTGDGTIALSGAGYFVWRLDNLLAGTTTVVVVYQNITDSTVAVMNQCLDFAVIKVQSLGLSGISSTSVLKKWIPREIAEIDAASLPLVAIAPFDRETIPGQLTQTDLVGYPIIVALVDRHNQDFTANFARNLLWRQKVFRAFRYQGADNSGIAEIINIVPEPRLIVDPAMWGENRWVSAFVFRFESREVRGM